MGDGGDGGDPGNRAQDKDRLLGKMLRIDVNGSSGGKHYRDPEVQPVRRQVRARRDLAARPAQPVALLVRSGDRQPLDRRRRPVPVRGDRPPRVARRGDNLGWRRMEGYKCYNPSSRCSKSGKAKPVARLLARGRALRGHRRLRLPRVGHPGAGRLVPVRRLLQRRDLGDPVHRGHAREQDPAAQHEPVDQLVRRERVWRAQVKNSICLFSHHTRCGKRQYGFLTWETAHPRTRDNVPP